MGDNNAERFAAKRKQLAAMMAQEEQQAGSFHQLRESYHKMLITRFSLLSEGKLWQKANRLASRDYIQRVDDMRMLYIGANGDDSGFQAPKLYYLVKANFNPHNADMLRMSDDEKYKTLEVVK